MSLRCGRWPTIVLVAATLLLAGCRSNDSGPIAIPGPDNGEAVPDPPPAPEPDPDPDPGPPDPSVIPQDVAAIDEAYAQAVLDALYAPDDAAFKLALSGAPFQDDALPVEVFQVVRHTITEEWQEAMLNVWIEQFTDPVWSEHLGQPGRSLPADQWQPPTRRVTGILYADRQCVLVEVAADLSGSVHDPPEDAVFRDGEILRARPVQDRDKSINPTAWRREANMRIDEAPDEWGEHLCDA